MSLPSVKILFENGLLDIAAANDDRVVGLVGSGTAVETTFVLETAYLITKFDSLKANLGITEANNPTIYKAVNEFYNEAPTGTKLWIMGVANTVTVADICDKTKDYAKKLLLAANGAIRFFMVAKQEPNGYTPTILNGLDADTYTAITNAQALCLQLTTDLYAPCFALLEGRRYTGTAANLSNLGERDDDRVAVLIGDTASGSNGAAIGVLAGRLASIPVQRKVSRIKSGALGFDNFYIGSKAAELADNDIIHDNGFITFRTIVGKAGYFFSGDKLATDPTSDYGIIARRCVIDKAYRIAYRTMVEELDDEIPVTDEGYFPASIVKSIQNKVEVAIENEMTAYKNLGVDPDNSNDTGVKCYIDYKQNVISTGKWEAKLRVKPYGYASEIDIYLGFAVQTN